MCVFLVLQILKEKAFFPLLRTLNVEKKSPMKFETNRIFMVSIRTFLFHHHFQFNISFI